MVVMVKGDVRLAGAGARQCTAGTESSVTKS